MNKEDTKQAILGFTEFFKGITGNQDLKIPDNIAKEYGIKQESCDNAISRQAVIDTIDKWVKNMHVLTALPANEITPLFESVHELPPIMPQPKMGKWEWVQYDSNPNIGNWHCSECRTIIPDMPEEKDNIPSYKWCPMCGCKMQEVEE